MFNINNWNWNQYKAAGKHAASYAAGAVTIGLAWGLVSQTDAATLTEAIGHITDGVEQLTKGIGMLAGVLVPIYTALRAARNASPQSQMNSVVTNLSAPQVTQIANAVEDPAGRNRLINAVASMPEVKGLVADANVARDTSSEKVVSSVAELPRAIVLHG